MYPECIQYLYVTGFYEISNEMLRYYLIIIIPNIIFLFYNPLIHVITQDGEHIYKTNYGVIRKKTKS